MVAHDGLSPAYLCSAQEEQFCSSTKITRAILDLRPVQSSLASMTASKSLIRGRHEQLVFPRHHTGGMARSMGFWSMQRCGECRNSVVLRHSRLPVTRSRHTQAVRGDEEE